LLATAAGDCDVFNKTAVFIIRHRPLSKNGCPVLL
jgi:hypothetical protein